MNTSVSSRSLCAALFSAVFMWGEGDGGRTSFSGVWGWGGGGEGACGKVSGDSASSIHRTHTINAISWQGVLKSTWS